MFLDPTHQNKTNYGLNWLGLVMIEIYFLIYKKNNTIIQMESGNIKQKPQNMRRNKMHFIEPYVP